MLDVLIALSGLHFYILGPELSCDSTTENLNALPSRIKTSTTSTLFIADSCFFVLTTTEKGTLKDYNMIVRSWFSIFYEAAKPQVE